VKTQIHCHAMVLKLNSLISRRAGQTVLALAISVSSVAIAEPRNPSGAFSEAHLERVSAPNAPGTATKSPAASGGASTADQSTADQSTKTIVKRWVKTQIRTIQSFFTGDESIQMSSSKSASAPATVAAAPARMAPPSAPLEKSLRAPAAAKSEDRGVLDAPGVVKTDTGVSSYDLATSPAVPLLKIEKEKSISRNQYALDAKQESVMHDRIVRQLESPALMDEKEKQALVVMHVARAGSIEKIKDAVFSSKGKVPRLSFDKIAMHLRPETELKLKTFKPLTNEENLFLSGLLLFQQGEQCPSALGLFHKLSKSKGWEAESNYYLAMCSKKLELQTDFHDRARRVLETQDVYYSKKVLAELSSDVPYEISESFGNALLKVSTNAKIMDSLKPEILANVAYILADFCVSSEHFKTALTWAPKVPVSHPKYLKAQFLLALAEYQAGSKAEAIKIQDKIINDAQIGNANLEFQALVALNAGRMHFQEQDFKGAHEDFQKVYKNHPLWVQSLTETGWAQLMDNDYEGAIGSMYSIQSPFFNAVYKPDSYVIRTIGYLNLCQYGDAYKTLSILEHDYRPYLESMEKYISHANAKSPNSQTAYQTVRNFMTVAKNATEVDGLPLQVVREMARHRDYTNLQKALNREIDERPNYSKVNGQVETSLKRAQKLVNNSRQYLDGIRKKLASNVAKHDSRLRSQLQEDLEVGLNKLNDGFFQVDLYQAAKDGMDEYRKEVVGGADMRIAQMRSQIEHVLSNRLLQMKVDLARVLDNNELLRYEVFAGSGENIRYQVAGGEVAKRVSASILPKSKSLQWDFDGEYWEDEIGHYRSTLKNNCPDKRAQASLDGGVK